MPVASTMRAIRHAPRCVQEYAQHVGASAEDRERTAPDDHRVAARGIVPHRVLHRVQERLVEGRLRRGQCQLRRRALETREEALPQRTLRVFVGVHVLGRDAQALGDHDGELLIHVCVTELSGHARRDR